MPVMLVVFDQDGLPLDTRGVELLDPDLAAMLGASYWRLSSEASEALGARIDRVTLRAGSLRIEMAFGADSGYALVIDELAASLLEAEEELEGLEEGAEEELRV